MERYRIGKLEWSDIWVWPGLIGILLAGFALWVLSCYSCEMPNDVRKVYIIFLIAGLFISLFKMKTILEYDGKFLYVTSIRLFVRYNSCKILVNSIVDVQFLPDFWARRTLWDVFCYKFFKLPRAERNFWHVLMLLIECFFYPFAQNIYHFDSERVSVADVCTYLKAKITYGIRECSFAVKRYDEVWEFMYHMKEDLVKGK